MVMKVMKTNSGQDNGKGKEKQLKERKEEKEGEMMGIRKQKGRTISSFVLSHFSVGSCLYCTLGADNRWPYH